MKSALLLAVAGALITLAFAPYNLWPLALLSPAVLLYYLRAIDSSRRAYVLGFSYLFGMFASGVSWVYVSIHVYGHASAPLAATFTALFVAFVAAVTALPLLAWPRLKRSLPLWLAFPTIWVACEFWRSWAFTGLPWLLAGYSQTDTPLAGWAAIGGVYWVSFLTLLTTGLLFSAARTSNRLRGFAIGAVGLIWLTGFAIGKVAWTTTEGEPVRVALVQPNVDQNEKWDPDFLQRIVNQLHQLSTPLWPLADVVIWPEGAVPAPYHRAMPFLAQQQQLAAAEGSVLITGIPYRQPDGRYTNSIVAMTGDDPATPQQYDKQRLVPFGEYVPLERQLRGIIAFFDMPMSNFTLGAKDQQPLTIADRNFAAAICYEIVYPDLVASNARDAGAIITLSNDAWFGHSIGPLQHLQMARFRAIELAKPVIRGTNNGVTALINASGEVTDELPQFVERALVGEVQLQRGQTPFARLQSWPTLLLVLMLLGFALYRGKA